MSQNKRKLFRQFHKKLLDFALKPDTVLHQLIMGTQQVKAIMMVHW